MATTSYLLLKRSILAIFYNMRTFEKYFIYTRSARHVPTSQNAPRSSKQRFFIYLSGWWVWNASGGRGRRGKRVPFVRHGQTRVFAEWELIFSHERVEIRATASLTSDSVLILRLSDSGGRGTKTAACPSTFTSQSRARSSGLAFRVMAVSQMLVS